jgi:hypothetical protein
MKQFSALDKDGALLAILEAVDEVQALEMAKTYVIGAESVAERGQAPDPTIQLEDLAKELEEKNKIIERLAKASPELSSAGNSVKLFSMWLARRASSMGIGKLQPNSERNMAYLVETFAEKMGLNLPATEDAEKVFDEIVVKKAGLSMD